MTDKLGGKITKTKTKGTKSCFIKRNQNFGDYRNCTEAAPGKNKIKY